ncbi:uncharacterized protein LOC144439418 [Glandiceps talaboti]
MSKSLLLTLVVNYVLGIGTACVLVGWEPKTLPERAKEADIVVYGEPVAKFKRPDVFSHEFWPEAYMAEFKFYCILKGEPLPSRENVTALGVITSCDFTEVEVGTKYIMFLKRRNGILGAQEINFQSASTVATGQVLTTLLASCPTLYPPLDKMECPTEVINSTNTSCIVREPSTQVSIALTTVSDIGVSPTLPTEKKKPVLPTKMPGAGGMATKSAEKRPTPKKAPLTSNASYLCANVIISFGVTIFIVLSVY